MQEIALHDREQVFIDWVSRGLTLLQAAQKAGYTAPSSAVRDLQTRPRVQAALAALRTQIEEEAKVSRGEVIEGMKEAIALARDLADPPSMIMGWRELGRLCGYYEQKQKVEVSINGHVSVARLETLTDTELLKIIEGQSEVIDVQP